MRVLHLDPFCGASGDMVLGCLSDLGADLAAVRERLSRFLPFSADLRAERTVRRGLAGTRVHVNVAEEHPPRRGLRDLLEVLGRADVPGHVRDLSERSFRLLAEAEARVHGTRPDEVHFHEIGAGDTLVDVIGTHMALADLGVERLTVGPVAVGSGTVRCAHGELPVPAPATLEILKGVPLRGSSASGELTTPTGAALLVTLASSFELTPAMTVERVGYGFGARDEGPMPNALRGLLGHADATGAEHEVSVLETTVDDMSGEVAGYLVEVLLATGALDVTTTPVGMKKSRPGVRITVLSPISQERRLAEIVLRETTTFGVRVRRERRIVLARRTVEVATPWGCVSVKVGELDGTDVQVSPEYEDCRRLAARAGVPLRDVQHAAVAAYRKRAGGETR